MPSTVAASRAHSVIGALRDTTDATVVPQLTPPSSPTLSRISPLPCSGRESGAPEAGWQDALIVTPDLIRGPAQRPANGGTRTTSRGRKGEERRGRQPFIQPE